MKENMGVLWGGGESDVAPPPPPPPPRPLPLFPVPMSIERVDIFQSD